MNKYWLFTKIIATQRRGTFAARYGRHSYLDSKGSANLGVKQRLLFHAYATPIHTFLQIEAAVEGIAAFKNEAWNDKPSDVVREKQKKNYKKKVASAKALFAGVPDHLGGELATVRGGVWCAFYCLNDTVAGAVSPSAGLKTPAGIPALFLCVCADRVQGKLTGVVDNGENGPVEYRFAPFQKGSNRLLDRDAEDIISVRHHRRQVSSVASLSASHRTLSAEPEQLTVIAS